MTSRDFAYWLQGLFELGKPTQLDATQTDLIKRHLAMVFVHEIDPSAGPPEKQAALDALHHGFTVGVSSSSGAVGSTAAKDPPRIGGTKFGPNGETLVFRC